MSRWGIIFLKPGAQMATSSWGEPDQVPFLSIAMRTTMERLDVPHGCWSASSCSCARCWRTRRASWWLELPGHGAYLVSDPAPESDPQHPVLYDDEVDTGEGITARIVVRRSAAPIALSPQRATRRGGLLIRSGRAAHEITLVGHESRPGARHLFGDVWCPALEELQRQALDAPRPQVVVKVDRSGLNEHHPAVQRLYAAIEQVVRPIVDAEERRAGAHHVNPTRAVTARDQVGLRALNDVLKNAFDTPGARGLLRGDSDSDRPPTTPPTPPTRRPPVITRSPSRRRRPSRTSRCASSSRRSACTPASSAAPRPASCARMTIPSPAPGGPSPSRPASTPRRSRSSSSATVPAAGSARSPARTRTPRSWPSSTPRPAWSPSSKAGASFGPWKRAARRAGRALRYRAHDKLMLAFLEPEVFDGGVQLHRSAADDGQASLLEERTT